MMSDNNTEHGAGAGISPSAPGQEGSSEVLVDGQSPADKEAQVPGGQD